jgi:hypothetical protein
MGQSCSPRPPSGLPLCRRCGRSYNRAGPGPDCRVGWRVGVGRSRVRRGGRSSSTICCRNGLYPWDWGRFLTPARGFDRSGVDEDHRRQIRYDTPKASWGRSFQAMPALRTNRITVRMSGSQWMAGPFWCWHRRQERGVKSRSNTHR